MTYSVVLISNLIISTLLPLSYKVFINVYHEWLWYKLRANNKVTPIKNDRP